MKYDCKTRPDINGKFGGYIVTPAEPDKDQQSSRALYRLNLEPKADPNRQIDQVKSNNGLEH